MSDAAPGISSHGTLIARAPKATPTAFVTIGELGDITMPGLMRNEFDVSTHNRNIDSWVAGILRRNPVTFPVFFNKGDATHNAVAGLRASMISGDVDGWRVTSPDGEVWVFSGAMTAMSEAAPVDGVKSVEVTIRPSGPFTLDGVPYGVSA